MKRDITDTWLRALPPPAKGARLEIRDAREPGLVLRITAKGAATWGVRTRTADGKQTRPKLGTWPTMGIAEARKEAKATLSSIQRGADPVAKKREARAERRARLDAATVADRLEEWRTAKEADKVRPWSASYADLVAGVVRRDLLPALGKRPLAETKRADWTGLIAAKRRKGAAAGATLYRTVSAFLNHAEAAGWIPAPLLPRKGLAALAPAVDARERVLTDAELREVWLASAKLTPKPRAFVRLLILTAARRAEVADLAAGELDRNAGRWTIPGERTKNGLPITLPLDTLAMAELQAVWPEGKVGPGYRLLGETKGGGVRGYSVFKRTLDAKIATARKEAGQGPMPPWRFHDLRRTARTGMTRLGVPRDHAEAAINHVSGRTALERTYDRHDYAAEILAALGAWQGHVAALVRSAMGSMGDAAAECAQGKEQGRHASG